MKHSNTYDKWNPVQIKFKHTPIKNIKTNSQNRKYRTLEKKKRHEKSDLKIFDAAPKAGQNSIGIYPTIQTSKFMCQHAFFLDLKCYWAFKGIQSKVLKYAVGGIDFGN